MDQPGKVANPARGQLNRENNIPLSPCVPENLVSRDGFSRPVPCQPAHLHTQAESGAYLRDSSRVPRRRPFMKPPYAIGSVPSLSGHAIAYRWRSLPRVRRHRASKPQGSSERVLPWQITMDQLIFASLSHTHYWYEMGMLKVPWTDAGRGFRFPRASAKAMQNAPCPCPMSRRCKESDVVPEGVVVSTVAVRSKYRDHFRDRIVLEGPLEHSFILAS